eukprot:12936866-Heterocapsa_arctica.AAC.1
MFGQVPGEAQGLPRLGTPECKGRHVKPPSRSNLPRYCCFACQELGQLARTPTPEEATTPNLVAEKNTDIFQSRCATPCADATPPLNGPLT